MGTRLFVGNLGFDTAEEQLRDVFAEFGNVVSVAIVTDRGTGRSRGFGFVEYDALEGAEKAIASMNGAMLDGRSLNVNVARERTSGGQGGNRGDRGGREQGRRW